MILAMNVTSDILRRPASHHYWGSEHNSTSSPRVFSERVSLPPIHKTIPELDKHKPMLLSPPDTVAAASTTMSARTTPTSQPSMATTSPSSVVAMAPTPEDVHSSADPTSPYKRRRLLETAVSAQGPRYQARHEIRHHSSHSYSHSRSRSHGYHNYSADADRTPTIGGTAGGTAGDGRERFSQAVPRVFPDPETRHFEYGETQPPRYARVSTSASPPSLYRRYESSTSRPGYPDAHAPRFEHSQEPSTRYAHDAYASSGQRPPQPADYQERPYRHYGQQPAYPHDYSSQYAQHPSRLQSLSAGSVPSYNRATFPSMTAPGASYTQPRPYPGQSYATGPMATQAPGYPHYSSREYPVGGGGYMTTSVMGGMGNGTADGKQRKRRGNLPKETTDKLRAWFLNHLHHPYPSEDEKHDLMRQTGLQMNQISNWFINARRRQLPGMLKNARAESNAMTSRSSSSAAGVRRNSNSSLDGRPEQQMAMRQFQPHKRRASDYGDEDRGNVVLPHGSPISDEGYDSVARPRQLTRGSV